jgi:tryptophanyl-tRNA synthetase
MESNFGKTNVLSGIRASNSSLHIGNYFGAIQGMIDLQNDGKHNTFYMVADLHGITTDFDPKELQKNRIEVVKDYLACGIDPEKSALFLQSDVEEHTELAYLLSSLSLVHDLLRMPSRKDEHKKYFDPGQLTNASFALLGYPVLMAADILLYKASKVPIGQDQEPHLEFTRNIARKLNNKYNLDFPIPERYSITAEHFRVPSIKGDGHKMSKSEPAGAIFLNDSPDIIRKKIYSIPTSTSGKGNKISENDIFFIFIELILGKDYRNTLEIKYKNEGIVYSEEKEKLANQTIILLKSIQDKRKYYEDNPEKVQTILDEGARKARKVASITLSEVKKKMGLLRR